MQNYNTMQRGRSGNNFQQMPSGNYRAVPTPRTSSCQQPTTSCRIPRDPLEKMPLAMAYVPWQTWENLHDVHKGFQRGTVFESLDKPFYGKGGCNR